MKRIWNIIVTAGLALSMASAQDAAPDQPLKIKWQPLKIARSHFPRSIAMMDGERDDYASNLSGVAIRQLHLKQADKESCELARRMFAIALHLSPRNKQAVVLNVKLAQGRVPPAPEADYRPQTLAHLLMNRAKILEKQEGEGNLDLAGYLFQLASNLDPKNEDAIYLSELYRINHGGVNWDVLTQGME